jgi:hypothetical protein
MASSEGASEVHSCAAVRVADAYRSVNETDGLYEEEILHVSLNARGTVTARRIGAEPMRTFRDIYVLTSIILRAMFGVFHGTDWARCEPTLPTVTPL